MQKQQSFYYQAQAGAPTLTDTAPKEPCILGYTACIGNIQVKG